jgi:hypothetical protein
MTWPRRFDEAFCLADSSQLVTADPKLTRTARPAVAIERLRNRWLLQVDCNWGQSANYVCILFCELFSVQRGKVSNINGSLQMSALDGCRATQRLMWDFLARNV